MSDDVGARVLADRTRRKMSRREYAELTGLSQTQVGNIEKGRKLKPGEWELLVPHLNGSADGVQEPSPPDASPIAGGPVGHDLTPPVGEPVSTEPPIVLLTEDEDEENVVESHTGYSAFGNETGNPITSIAQTMVLTELQPQPEAVAVQFTGRLVSNSEVQSFKRCKRQWWLAWYRHLELAAERPLGARQIGTWVHKAMARKYVPDGQVSEDPREALERVLTDVNTVITQTAQQLLETADDQGLSAEALVQRFKKDADLARAMVEGYVDWLAETGADEGLKIIGSEQVIAAPLMDVHADQQLTTLDPTETLVQIIGKLDVRARRAVDHFKAFLDHKTLSSFERATRMIGQNEQMLHYLLLEQSQPEDEPTAGALYNMMRKVKRTATAKPPFYQRVEVRHNTTEVDTYRRHLVGSVANMLVAEHRLSLGEDHHVIVPPSPREDCAWSCDFVTVCQMLDDGSRAEDMISQLYRTTEHLGYYDDVNEYDESLDT